MRQLLLYTPGLNVIYVLDINDHKHSFAEIMYHPVEQVYMAA